MQPVRQVLSALGLAALLIAGCDKADDAKQPTAKQAEPAPAPEPKQPEPKQPEPKQPEPELPPIELALGAAKIMPKDQPDKAVVLAADGTITLSGESGAGWKLSADGKLGKPDGTSVAEVAGNGAVTIAGKRSGIVLVETGLELSSPDGRKVSIAFGEDGSVNMQPSPGPDMQMTAEGCAGPMARTCALVLAIYLFTETR